MCKKLVQFDRRILRGAYCVAVGALIVPFFATSALAVPIVITSAFGNGADHYVSENVPDTTPTLDHRFFARTNAGSSRHEVTYIRFDTSSVAGTISDAAIELYQLGGGDVTYNLFGLTDAPSETSSPWAPNTITYNTAPGMLLPIDGNTGTSDLNPSPTVVTPLGSYFLSTADNVTKILSSPAITAFLNGDTNGLVTFMIESTAGSATTFRSSRTAFTGSEHGPRLVLTVVPEPGSISLGIIGMVGLCLLARRRPKWCGTTTVMKSTASPGRSQN